MNTTAVTSLLVCDTPAVGYVIRRALACHDGHIVKVVNKPSLLQAGIDAVRPDIVIVELSLFGADAGDAITELAAQHPDVRIVVYGREILQGDMVEAGADAFVPVGAPAAAICAAVLGVRDPRLAA